MPECGFDDPVAGSLLAEIGFDARRVLHDRSNVAGAIHRAQVLDTITESFAAVHPGGLVVSAGVGLCTRNHRLAGRVPPTLRWAGVDMPEVVELRRRLLPDERMALHAGALDDKNWAAPIDELGHNVLVLAEGMIMYLDRAGLTGFLTGARARFGLGTVLAMDYFHPLVARSGRHPIVRATGAQFRSGARNGAALARMIDGLRLRAEWPVMERIGPAQRAVARTFRIGTGGGRLYAVAELAVTG